MALAPTAETVRADGLARAAKPRRTGVRQPGSAQMSHMDDAPKATSERPVFDGRSMVSHRLSTRTAVDTAVQSSGEEAIARATALGAVQREDGLWIIECAWCGRVGSVAGDWHTLAPAIRTSLRAVRTHGICASCVHTQDPSADDKPGKRTR